MTDHRCPVCGDGFSTDASLQDHCWDAHGACHHCGDEFDDRESLFVHWLAVHDDRLSSRNRARAESAVGPLAFRDRLAHQGPAAAIAGVSVSRRGLLAGGLLGLGGALGWTLLSGSSGGGTGLAGHAAATGVDAQPTLGPAPAAADATIIAFEDPSCPSCARFERRTFPKLRSELVDSGRLSFVYRGIPVVYEWAGPAVLALEATYARRSDAFWALKDYYYRDQGRIGTGNVRERTRRFLAEQTTVDAAAVLADVDGGVHRDAVDADLQTSRNAGVRGTPTFFLFRDGSFATKVVGPKSFEVFRNALGL